MRVKLMALWTAAALLIAAPQGAAQPPSASALLNAAVDPQLAAGAVLIDRGVAADFDADTPFYVPNYGAPTTLVVACAQCRTIRVAWRTHGMTELEPAGAGPGPVFSVAAPAAFLAAPSNIQVTLSIAGGRRGVTAFAYAVLQEGPLRTARERGFGGVFDDAAWDAAPDLGPGVTTTRKPTAEELAFFYPPLKLREGRTGAVRVQCLVGEAGALACRAPSGEGVELEFADAAVRLSTLVRISETDANGASTAGRRAILPLTFALGE